jgi:hypothetical protein
MNSISIQKGGINVNLSKYVRSSPTLGGVHSGGCSSMQQHTVLGPAPDPEALLRRDVTSLLVQVIQLDIAKTSLLPLAPAVADVKSVLLGHHKC